MNRLRPWGWFLAVELAVLGAIYGPALWGASLLAPLDIAAGLFSKFQHVDPQAGNVPANHHCIDALVFDLPVQHAIHLALRRGEIPWWDPYALGGWPMLAESHSHGFDPVRLLAHAVLPFELAYNWGHALHVALCGLGMFLLLRRLAVAPATAALLAGAFQSAGCITFFFMQPWIQSIFGWYPLLWLAWESAFRRGGVRGAVPAALLVAACLYSGSLQSHAYLGVFAIGLGCGYAGRDLKAWGRWMTPVVASGVLGACLAAPVLFNEVELFFLSTRQVGLVSHSRWGWLSGIASLTGVFPWCLGSFRTLDLSRLLGQSTLGFCLFIGSAGVVLAVLGALQPAAVPARSPAVRASMALVVLYLVILSTPLRGVLYPRCSALAGMGLTILAAHGLEVLGRRPAPARKAGLTVAAVAAGLAVCLHVAAFVAYPRLLPRVRQMMAQYDQKTTSFDSAPALRAHQIDTLPAEISFQNPAVLIAWLSLAGLAAWLWNPRWRVRSWTGTALLVVNLVPVVWVARQFTPNHPIALWQRLKEGGPEQRRIAARLRGTPLRLWEISPGTHEMAMPLGLPILYEVRAVHGYTSLLLPSLQQLPPDARRVHAAQMGDWVYESRSRGLEAGEFHGNAGSGLARFQWIAASPRRFTIEDAGPCAMRLRFDPVEAGGGRGRLLWTDTPYPGWRAWVDGASAPLGKHPPCFTEIVVPASARELLLRYRPTYLSLGLAIALAGGIALGTLGLIGWCSRRGPRFTVPRAGDAGT